MKYLLIAGLLILAWCPWLTRNEAANLVGKEVTRIKTQYQNLCKTWIEQNSLTKVPFGYTQKVWYDCTENDPDYGITRSTNIVFVSFAENVWNVPKKIVTRNP